MLTKEEMLAYCQKLLKLHHLALSDRQLHQLFTHYYEVERFSRPLGLIKATDSELVEKHLVDSLLALPYLEKLNPQSCFDVGSGAGFPGIPLAIARPKTAFTLIERKAKRSSFLAGTVALLGLNNVTVFHNDIDMLTNKADLILFRALTPLSVPFIKQLKSLSPQIMAYKGRWDQAKEETDRLKKAGFKIELIKLLKTGPSERTLCLIS